MPKNINFFKCKGQRDLHLKNQQRELSLLLVACFLNWTSLKSTDPSTQSFHTNQHSHDS